MDILTLIVSVLVTLAPVIFGALSTLGSYRKAKTEITDIASLFSVLDAALADNNVTEDEWNQIYAALKKIISDAVPAPVVAATAAK